MRTVSVDAARRIALGAQGFSKPRPTGKVTRAHLRRVFADVGLIQIDSVNVLVRTQEMPLFARLGPHPRTLIPEAVAAGELFEYWCHAASILPTAHHHLHRWRMAKWAEHAQSDASLGSKRKVIDSVFAQVRERGPIAVGDLEGRVRTKNGTWWDWDDGKIALEHLFAIGKVAATRRHDFARLYDLAERVIPADALATPAADEHIGRTELIRQASRFLGIATVADLADYHHQRGPVIKTIVDELVAAGELVPVEVPGWTKAAFLHPDASTPRAVRGRALLSPFDSLVFNRDRVSRLFDFDYRIEIYVPAPKRIYGYYVLPFLLDGHLAARVDLKADRKAGVLRVQAAFVEADLDNGDDRPFVAEQLAAELSDMAGWLGLDTVGVTDRGTLAADLRRAGVSSLD